MNKIGSVSRLLSILSLLLFVVQVANGQTNDEKTFLQIVGEIYKLVGHSEYRLIGRAAEMITNSSPHPFYRGKPSIEMALAIQFLDYHRVDPIEGFKRRSKFKKVYNEKVLGPCELIKKLGIRYDNFMSAHPEADTYGHSFGILPIEWFDAVDICRKGSLEKTYEQFKRLKDLL